MILLTKNSKQYWKSNIHKDDKYLIIRDTKTDFYFQKQFKFLNRIIIVQNEIPLPKIFIGRNKELSALSRLFDIVLKYPYDEFKRIVYDLMTTGIIVQNGGGNYHITSYFHLLAFLELYTNKYDQFLFEILQNKYFH